MGGDERKLCLSVGVAAGPAARATAPRLSATGFRYLPPSVGERRECDLVA